MQWQDEGIILASRSLGEGKVIVTLLTKDHGKAAGVWRIGRGKKASADQAMIQPGQHVAVHWQARLAEHLGFFRLEKISSAEDAMLSILWRDALPLSLLQAAMDLLYFTLPEHHPYPQLYQGAQNFLGALTQNQDPFFLGKKYLEFELIALRELGYGLDFSSCAATGVREDLIYVSPKSGRAVSREAGTPYHQKMLPLPEFLLAEKTPSWEELQQGFQLCAYFFAPLWESLRTKNQDILASRERAQGQLYHRAKAS